MSHTAGSPLVMPLLMTPTAAATMMATPGAATADDSTGLAKGSRLTWNSPDPMADGSRCS
jgi:hypothetical protein